MERTPERQHLVIYFGILVFGTFASLYPTTRIFNSSCSSSVTKIRITFPLAVFLRPGKLYFSNASDSIYDYLTPIFPKIFLGDFLKFCGFDLLGSHGLSARSTWRTKSKGPKSLQLEVKTSSFVTYIIWSGKSPWEETPFLRFRKIQFFFFAKSCLYSKTTCCKKIRMLSLFVCYFSRDYLGNFFWSWLSVQL